MRTRDGGRPRLSDVVREPVGLCDKCGGRGWICETHLDMPYPHPSLDDGGECAGPGMPCDCAIGRRLVRELNARYRPDCEQ